MFSKKEGVICQCSPLPNISPFSSVCLLLCLRHVSGDDTKMFDFD